MKPRSLFQGASRPDTHRWIPRRFRLVVIVSCSVLGAGIVCAIATNEGQSWLAVVLFGVLCAAAENRDRVFSDETGLSGSVAVALAAAFFFAGEGWIWGAFVSCAVGGIYLPHLRSRSMSKVVINGASFGLSALAASSVVTAVVDETPASLLLWIGLAGATLVYWVLNSVVLGVALSTLTRSRFMSQFSELVRSDTVMLVFGLGGALCGLVMVEVGIPVGIATLVALLVALDVFVISSPGGLVDLKAAWVMVVTRGVSGGVAGTVGALVTRAASVSVLGAFAGLTAGFVAGISVVAVVIAVLLIVRYGRADIATLGGLVVAESVVPILAAVSGVVTAIAGLDVGLFVASGLVLGASAVVALRRHRAARRPKVTDEDALMAAVVEAMMDGLPAHER